MCVCVHVCVCACVLFSVTGTHEHPPASGVACPRGPVAITSCPLLVASVRIPVCTKTGIPSCRVAFGCCSGHFCVMCVCVRARASVRACVCVHIHSRKAIIFQHCCIWQADCVVFSSAYLGIIACQVMAVQLCYYCCRWHMPYWALAITPHSGLV